MQTTTGKRSLWLEGLPATGHPGVSGAERYDVAVIGGGLAGLTTALLLKRAGVRVAVLEAGRVGAGVSGNNTAKVTALQATVYSRIVGQHGAAAAADYAQASAAGVDLVADLVEREHIECDLRRATAFTYAISEQERERRDGRGAGDARSRATSHRRCRCGIGSAVSYLWRRRPGRPDHAAPAALRPSTATALR